MAKTERQSNIELLRVIAILGVVILHYNGIGGALDSTSGINHIICLTFESLFICSVDLFMLISGYFSCNSKKTIAQKPIKLLLQVIVFSGAWYLISCIKDGSFSISLFLRSLVPANYFVILYVVVYLLSPYLNKIYEYMNSKLVVLLIVLFSVYPTLVDVFNIVTKSNWMGLSSIGLEGNQSGYTIVNFVLMYFIGMFIRKEADKFARIKNVLLVLILCIDIAVLVVVSYYSSLLHLPADLSRTYCNPLVILESIIAFILFSRLNIGSIKWINKLSAACFTTFLIHAYFLSYIRIDWAVQQNPIVLVLHMLLSAIIIYLISFCVFFVYDLIIRFLFKKIDRKKMVITDLK